MSRVGSVTSMLKKIFNREDSRTDPKSDSQELSNLVTNQTHKPVVTPTGKPGGSIRLANETIEEVDEQLTITSQRSAHEDRPHVMTIFGPPNRSDPIAVPHAHSVGEKWVFYNFFFVTLTDLF